MRRKDNAGLFINILILLIAILIAVLFFVHYNHEQNALTEGISTSNINIEVSSIQGEKIDDFGDRTKKEYNNTEQNTIEIPILDENISANPKKSAASGESKYYQYYYMQLDDNSKKIYDAIENNIENIKNGDYVIEIPNEVGNVLDQENGEATLNEEFQSAWDAIVMDRVDLFFVDVSKVTLEMRTISYGRTKTHKLAMKPNAETYLESNFYNREVVNTALAQVENVRKQVIANLSGTDYDKIVQVNDWLVDNLEYGTIYGDNAYNIYGAMMGRNCVCEGYAETFKYVMDELKIPCILVTGIAENSEGNSENHEWNYVMLDEKWYAVDSTWNDPILVGGGKLTNELKHKYLLSGKSIYSNHSPNGKISVNGKTFTYPELNQSDY